jgi:hypothetical protein
LFSRRDCVRVLQRSAPSTVRIFCLQKREAERRKAHHPLSAPHQQTLPFADGSGAEAGLSGARSPSGASRRRLSQRANAATQPRPCFARSRGCRRYPRRRSCLSQAPGAPVILPAGTAVCTCANCVHLFAMPKPPGSGVTSPARRNRTRSIQRLSPVDVPEVSELLVGNTTGDDCQ